MKEGLEVKLFLCYHCIMIKPLAGRYEGFHDHAAVLADFYNITGLG